MKPYVVLINETQYLSKPVARACGTYWGVYVFDVDTLTHCCEITPSHWLECVAFETEKAIDDDMYEMLGEFLHESSHYRHAHRVLRLDPQEVPGDFETFEEACEYASCNHFWRVPT